LEELAGSGRFADGKGFDRSGEKIDLKEGTTLKNSGEKLS
jgi:hypothetical protein